MTEGRDDSYKKAVQTLLAARDIVVNGDRPWDIQVRNDKLYQRVLAGGSLALGESYMDGWWDCAQIDELIARIVLDKPQKNVGMPWSVMWWALLSRLFNMQSRSRSHQSAQAHYDIGNDLYQAMLDLRLVYTCAYWKDASDLDSAQEAKLDLTCRKLGLKPGQKILDIGCGWGSFLKFAAERYGVSGVGVTVSEEQVKLGRELCVGLPIEIRLQDYRDVREEFDHVVSLGMFEHVGHKNYRTYMEVVRRCLKDDGLFLLHTFGNNVSVTRCDPWFDKYIFPNGMIPSIAQVGRAAEGLFAMEDWHNFGADYDRTLMAWHANFERSWPDLAPKYAERFHRMWKYYLLSLAGWFRARNIQLWQIVFSKRGVPGGYTSVR